MLAKCKDSNGTVIPFFFLSCIFFFVLHWFFLTCVKKIPIRNLYCVVPQRCGWWFWCIIECVRANNISRSSYDADVCFGSLCAIFSFWLRWSRQVKRWPRFDLYMVFKNVNKVQFSTFAFHILSFIRNIISHNAILYVSINISEIHLFVHSHTKLGSMIVNVLLESSLKMCLVLSLLININWVCQPSV